MAQKKQGAGMTELSPTAQQLLAKFKREHGIKTYQSKRGYWYAGELTVAEITELEAVRALCKTVGKVCEL